MRVSGGGLNTRDKIPAISGPLGGGVGTYAPWDIQLRWAPAFASGGEFALGLNNMFDEDTPGCFSCDVNNMDPSVHDVPGRFGYFRVSYKQ